LLVSLALERSQAAVDMLTPRLAPVRYADAKLCRAGSDAPFSVAAAS
jgi:hypothetical protein